MASLCLASDLQDLKKRLSNIYIGDSFNGGAIYARDLKAHGAMSVLLKDAIKPNLVQTLEGNPAIIHGGPFANIAQGTNSVIATKMGMSLSDYVVTEAGFGADLGAEKFFNIKCRTAGISPKAVCLVATVRALRYHGGIPKNDLASAAPDAVQKGLVNLDKHLENLESFGVPVVVAVNHFETDSDEEVKIIIDHCNSKKVPVAVCRGWAEGGKGSTELAEKVIEAVATCKSPFVPTYDLNAPVEDKIFSIANRIYGATDVEYTQSARDRLKRIYHLGLDKLAICMAKTQSSFSDDAKGIGRPRDFKIQVREIEIASGAGFIIPITGKMLRMPGLPETPAAEFIDIDEHNNIIGLS
jgi:formate--tetrahydrofolate ligase